MKIKKSELIPIYENVKSYYKKAIIKKYYNKDDIINKYELISYKSKIIELKDYKIKFNYKDINNKKIYTNTTLRHIKEFIKQYYYYLELYYKDIINKDKLTKADIKKLIELSK